MGFTRYHVVGSSIPDVSPSKKKKMPEARMDSVHKIHHQNTILIQNSFVEGLPVPPRLYNLEA
jgi:hypothetical protein